MMEGVFLMGDMMTKLEQIREEIETLEEGNLTWANLEKLSILYNVEHHLCKKMGMEFEFGEKNSEGIGFSANGRVSSGTISKEMREMANGMSKQQLTDMIVGYARDINQNGNNNNVMRLYNRMRGYNNGNNNT